MEAGERRCGPESVYADTEAAAFNSPQLDVRESGWENKQTKKNLPSRMSAGPVSFCSIARIPLSQASSAVGHGKKGTPPPDGPTTMDPVPSPCPRPAWAAPGFNRFPLEPRLGRSFTPTVGGAGSARPAVRTPSPPRRAAQSAEPESGARSRSRSRGGSREDADKALRFAAPAEVAALVAAAAEDRVSLTHPVRTGAERDQSGWSPCRSPSPSPSRSPTGAGAGRAGGRSLRASAASSAAARLRATRRPRGRGRACGSTLLLPPSSSPFSLPPSRLPGSSDSSGAGTAAVGTRSLPRVFSPDSRLGDSSSNRVRGRVRAPA